MSVSSSERWLQAIEAGAYGDCDLPQFRKIIGKTKKYAFFKTVSRLAQPDSRILELGCGWACSSFALAEQGFKVTASDLSEILLGTLKKICAKMGEPFVSRLNFKQADLFELKRLNQKFDLIFSDGVFQHFAAEERVRGFREVYQALETRGLFVVSIPNLRNPFLKLLASKKIPFMHDFSLSELQQELNQAGFEIVETSGSFVNPGYRQWLKNPLWALPVELAGVFLGRVLTAHNFCVARKRAL